MPYKIENDLQVLLREQELIESSESFIHELDDLFRQNITLPSYQSDQAENFLYSLRKDTRFTEEEARLLDLCLVPHTEHGGGRISGQHFARGICCQ